MGFSPPDAPWLPPAPSPPATPPEASRSRRTIAQPGRSRPCAEPPPALSAGSRTRFRPVRARIRSWPIHGWTPPRCARPRAAGRLPTPGVSPLGTLRQFHLGRTILRLSPVSRADGPKVAKTAKRGKAFGGAQRGGWAPFNMRPVPCRQQGASVTGRGSWWKGEARPR